MYHLTLLKLGKISLKLQFVSYSPSHRTIPYFLIHRTVWLFKVGRATQGKDTKIDRKTTSPFTKKGCVLLSQVNFISSGFEGVLQ